MKKEVSKLNQFLTGDGRRERNEYLVLSSGDVPPQRFKRARITPVENGLSRRGQGEIAIHCDQGSYRNERCVEQPSAKKESDSLSSPNDCSQRRQQQADGNMMNSESQTKHERGGVEPNIVARDCRHWSARLAFNSGMNGII